MPVRAIALFGSLALLAPVMSASAAERVLPVIDPAAWSVTASAGDRVQLAVEGGRLVVAYDLAVATAHQVGHRSQTIGQVRLLLARPVTVGADEARVAFAACGLDEQVQLRPLLRDAGGEELSYSPHPANLLLAGPAGSWRDWRTTAFLVSEAGGAQQDIFEASGGDGNARPDGQLTLLGLELRVVGREDRPAPRRQGVAVLASLALRGERVEERDPVSYADAFLRDKGRYRLGLEGAESYQGPAVAASVVEIDYDPANAASRGQRLVFPDGGGRQTWIRCAIERDGRVVQRWERRWERDLPPAVSPKPAVAAPAVGCLGMIPGDHPSGVYRADEPLRIPVRVLSGAGARTLRWEARPFGFSATVAAGEMPVPSGGDQAAELAIEVPAAAQAGAVAWSITAEVRRDGVAIDRAERLVGRARPVEAYASRQGLVRGRDFVKRGVYTRTTYLPPEGSTFATMQQAVDHFALSVEESSQISPYLTYMVELDEFEVLPGVFDFALLDRLMDAASDRGCAITIRFAHTEKSHPYRWMPYTRPRAWDGAYAGGHPTYGAFAVDDEEFVACWLRAFRAVHDRYRTHPGFQGYYLMQPSGEWNVPDQPWDGTVTGYSRVDRIAFRAWLRSALRLDLAALNARWGSAFAAWDAVQPPQPDFARGAAPDLRLAWLDFCRFKQGQEEGWFPRACEAIRAYDREHVIIAYGGQRQDLSPDPALLGKADYLHNGGNHFLIGEGSLVDAWREGLGWITEPHHPHRWAAYGDPGKGGWSLDRSVYVMLAQAGAGGANLHVYYIPKPDQQLVSHFGGHFAYDRMQTFRPVLTELHDMQLVRSQRQVAVLQGQESLFCKHRTIFASRRQDLRRWFELLKQDSVPYEDFVPANAAGYRLLVLNPLDEVMGRDDIEAVERAVRGGATVLVSGRAGRFCPDLGAEEYPLLRRLGIAPPSAAFRCEEAGQKAAAIADSPLLAAGAAVPFYSQSDNLADLRDPRLGERFWTWPYRWLPRSDYFGRFPAVRSGGEVLARFPDGGDALSIHAVGKGRAVVLWGTPRIDDPAMAGFMARLAAWCGVVDPSLGRAIPLMLEGRNDRLDRSYAILYHETAGEYEVRLPSARDGRWFLDEMVSGQKLGVYDGAELRNGALRVIYHQGYSPLKVLRAMPAAGVQGDWLGRYRSPGK